MGWIGEKLLTRIWGATQTTFGNVFPNLKEIMDRLPKLKSEIKLLLNRKLLQKLLQNIFVFKFFLSSTYFEKFRLHVLGFVWTLHTFLILMLIVLLVVSVRQNPSDQMKSLIL
jgi:hypothetical protein